ncbi:MAG TPA: hypothetical protein VF725_12390 [Ktedonobacterales bacterium]|jgi:hypothetical protein
MQGPHPDARGLVGQQAWESEQEKRLNPWGPARPTPDVAEAQRQGGIWKVLRALWPWGRKRDDAETPGAE